MNPTTAAAPLELRACPNPVFIIGSPRSGTTILAWSLAQHSQLWTSGEFHLFWRLFGDGGRLDNKFEQEKQFPGWIQAERVEKNEFFAYLGLGLNALFTSRSQGKRWIEQTPGNTLMADMLAELFPGAVFLHILRDGRRTVNSMIHFENAHTDALRTAVKNAGYYPSWATDFTAACKMWSKSVTVAMEFAAKHPQRCLTFRYEDLVATPAKTFGEIFQFLGVATEAKPEQYFSGSRVNSSFSGQSKEPGAADKHLDPWEHWTAKQKTIFRKVAGPVSLKYVG